MTELNAATVADVTEFFQTYYAPNNAVLVLVGDFKTDEAVALVKKYFADIPRQPDPPAVDLSEPERKEERRATLEDALARVPQVSMAFKAVPGNTPDFYALEILSATLGRGQSSRLYQKLVKEKELVNNVGSFMDERSGPGALYITTTLRPGKKPEETESAIYEEIARLQQEPRTDAELQKAKNATTLSLGTSLQISLVRALRLGEYAAYSRSAPCFRSTERLRLTIPKASWLKMPAINELKRLRLDTVSRLIYC